MQRQFLMVAMLLSILAGCPHEWGRGGTIDRALEKDMRDYYQMRNCPLDEEEWAALCKRSLSTSPESASCPPSCRPTLDR